MSNCVITLDITEYQPESINFDTFAFVFRSEAKDFEEEISHLNKNSILHMCPLGKKDLKYNIKITKAGSLVGIAEFIIPNGNLIKKEESFSKLCPITMTDSIKRFIFGSITASNTIKILVNASIQYVDKTSALKQSHSLPKKDMKQYPISPKSNIQPKPQTDVSKEIVPVRETKTPPINTLKKPNDKMSAGIKKQALTNHKSSPNTNKNTPLIDASISQNEKTVSLNATPVAAVCSSIENDPKDTSVIDPFITEEIIQVDNKFNEFISKCIRDLNASDINSLTDINGLLFKTKESIAKIFRLQQEYYQKMSSSIDSNNKLRELLLKYNEKYRSIVKKQNRLKEQLESNGFRKEIAVTLRPEECECTKDLIPIKKHELRIYQNVFNKFYLDSDIQNFKEVNNQTKEQSLLVLAMKNVIGTYGNLTKLSSSLKKASYQQLVEKYALPNDAASIQNSNNTVSNMNEMPMSAIPETKVNEEIEESNEQHKEVPKPKEILKQKEIIKGKEIGKPKEGAKPKEIIKPKDIIKSKEVAKFKEITKSKEIVKSKEIAKPKETTKSKEISKPQDEVVQPKEEVVQPKEEVVVQPKEEVVVQPKEEVEVQPKKEIVPSKEVIFQSEKNTEREECKEREEREDIVDLELENVVSLMPDLTDIKLNNYLTFFYTKRKLVRIPFKKTSTNNYEYGSQKIMIKMEGETFRVRNIAGYHLLDKFIEINAPIEEAKIKNPKGSSPVNKPSTKTKKAVNAGKK